MGIRIRRIFAFIIDGYIAAAPFSVVAVINLILKNEKFYRLSSIVCLLICAFVMIFRDVIFGRRSIGKRALGIIVMDKSGIVAASVKQRLLRSLFFFLYQIDGILLMLTGESIGDRVAGTTVVKY